MRVRVNLRGIFVAAVAYGFLAPHPGVSDRLPLKVYTPADGLASDLVQCILPDSHGFI